MAAITRSELVVWMEIIPTGMDCLMHAAPALPQDVLLALLEREWVRYAKDGRLLRTAGGHQIAEGEQLRS